MSADRIAALENAIRDLLAAADVAIDQMALAFAEVDRMRKRWDVLSVKLSHMATRAEKLLTPPPPPPPPVKRRRKVAAHA
jgi:hypothetical protein